MVAVYAFSPSTWEEGRGRQLSEISEAGLQNKFQDSHGHTVKLCLEKTKQNSHKKKKKKLELEYGLLL